MATFNSLDYVKGTIFRAACEDKEEEASVNVFIPSGTTLAINDVINLAWFGAGHDITEVTINHPDLDSDGSPTLTTDIGIYMVDGDGSAAPQNDVDAVANAATVMRAAGTTRYAPSTAYADAAFGAVANLTNLAYNGLLRIVVDAAAAGATAANGTIRVLVKFKRHTVDGNFLTYGWDGEEV